MFDNEIINVNVLGNDQLYSSFSLFGEEKKEESWFTFCLSVDDG
jgi:hypothetical protein